MSEARVGDRLDGTDGSIGKIVAVIGDGPEWLVARVGRLGQFTAVPASDAVQGAGAVWVPYSRELIRAAPRVEAKPELDEATARSLREHYGFG